MSKAITFRMDDDRIQMLDELATTMDRDRSYLINEAVGNYLEIKQWHIAETRKAIAEADAGDFASDEEVRAAFAAFRAQGHAQRRWREQQPGWCSREDGAQ
jgi:predicted transcriptional regulator